MKRFEFFLFILSTLIVNFLSVFPAKAEGLFKNNKYVVLAQAVMPKRQITMGERTPVYNKLLNIMPAAGVIRVLNPIKATSPATGYESKYPKASENYEGNWHWN